VKKKKKKKGKRKKQGSADNRKIDLTLIHMQTTSYEEDWDLYELFSCRLHKACWPDLHSWPQAAELEQLKVHERTAASSRKNVLSSAETK
jgi:hypothetical protein